MIQPDLAKRIAIRADAQLRPAAEHALAQLARLGLPPSVVSFYRSYEPTTCAEIEGVRLWPISDVIEENEKYVPGADVSPHGLIVFATTIFGDAYCFDISQDEPPVVLLSHELPFDGMQLEQVRALAKPIAPGFDAFLTSFLDGALDMEPIDEIS